MVAMLRSANVSRVHIHHLLWFEFDTRAMILRLGVPFDVTIHDNYVLCPQLNMLPQATSFYCGGPDIATCNACIAISPSANQARDILSWRLKYAWQFTDADRVICPSQDMKERLSGSCRPAARWSSHTSLLRRRTGPSPCRSSPRPPCASFCSAPWRTTRARGSLRLWSRPPRRAAGGSLHRRTGGHVPAGGSRTGNRDRPLPRGGAGRPDPKGQAARHLAAVGSAGKLQLYPDRRDRCRSADRRHPVRRVPGTVGGTALHVAGRLRCADRNLARHFPTGPRSAGKTARDTARGSPPPDRGFLRTNMSAADRRDHGR